MKKRFDIAFRMLDLPDDAGECLHKIGSSFEGHLDATISFYDDEVIISYEREETPEEVATREKQKLDADTIKRSADFCEMKRIARRYNLSDLIKDIDAVYSK